ncbi:hypothetical protein UFOVP611_14 [uncultured Caudovirales phage]|uniref:Uncharacterized protein n=1 Tax=uncultured Caudovirales phage TaxID=2100421 RepID=A0A6J5NA89_9CAUD|nr:hypothetical protein UFOVP611_14 [uncultured Caudovirales phage]
MFLTPSDFTGKFELHTGMYVQQKLVEYIERYEKRYLVDLFGEKLYNEFVNDIDPVTKAPKSPNFITVFNPFIEDVTLYETINSEGILDMLKGFIYFEYSKDNFNQQTVYGNVQQRAENSQIVNTLQTLIYNRYNEAVTTFRAIRDFIFIHPTPELGQVVDMVIVDAGETYATTNSITPTPLSGSVLLTNVSNIGTGYATNTNVATSGGSGTGLTVDYTDDGAGGIATVTIVNEGTGYVIGDIVAILDGNADATLTVDSATQIIIGTGLTIDVTANPIGGIVTNTLTTPGTGYVMGAGLTTTTTGSGSDCIVSVEVDNAGAITTFTVEDGGFSYAIGDIVTITGGNNDATFTVDSVTNGEITALTVATAGTKYQIGDLFKVPGGDNTATFELLYVGVGNYGKYNGKIKQYAYWL